MSFVATVDGLRVEDLLRLADGADAKPVAKSWYLAANKCWGITTGPSSSGKFVDTLRSWHVPLPGHQRHGSYSRQVVHEV